MALEKPEQVALNAGLNMNNEIELPDAELVAWEEIESEMGKLLIYVMRDRRNHYYTQVELITKEYKEQAGINAASYRNKMQIVWFVLKVGLDATNIAFIAAPQIAPKLQDTFNHFTGKNITWLQDRFPGVAGAQGVYKGVDLQKFSEASQKFFNMGDGIVTGGRGIWESFVTANRVEGNSKQELNKIRLEERERTQQESVRDLKEAERVVNEAQRKRESNANAMTKIGS